MTNSSNINAALHTKDSILVCYVRSGGFFFTNLLSTMNFLRFFEQALRYRNSYFRIGLSSLILLLSKLFELKARYLALDWSRERAHENRKFLISTTLTHCSGDRNVWAAPKRPGMGTFWYFIILNINSGLPTIAKLTAWHFQYHRLQISLHEGETRSTLTKCRETYWDRNLRTTDGKEEKG